MTPKGSFINTETTVNKDNTTNNLNIEIDKSHIEKIGMLLDELVLLLKNLNKKYKG